MGLSAWSSSVHQASWLKYGWSQPDPQHVHMILLLQQLDEKMLNFVKDGSTASYKLYCLYSCDVLQHNNLSNSYWNISVWIKALESVKTPTLLWSCSQRYNMTQISHVPCEHHILSLSKLIYGIKFVLCYHYVASLAIRGIIKWFNSGTTEQ